MTDPGFSRRLRDLFDHQKDHEKREFELLKYGRHFRLHGEHKAIVGRTKHDNNKILQLVDPQEDITIRMRGAPGPIVLIPSGAPKDIIEQAATLCAAYGKIQNGQSAHVSVKVPGGLKTLKVTGKSRSAFQPLII